MMRKTVLSFIALSLVLSLLLAFPTASAEITQTAEYDWETVAEIDFESDAQFNFYQNNKNHTESEVYKKGERDENQNQTNFYQVWRAASINKESPYADYARYCGSIQLCNTEGTELLKLEEGATVKLSLDLKAVFASNWWENGAGAWQIRVGLIFAQYDKSGRIDTDGDGENKGIVKYVEEGKFFDICGVNPDVGGWYNQSKEITVPAHEENEYPTLILYTEEAITGNIYPNVRFDNIVVSKPTNTTSIDFTGEQESFYVNNTAKDNVQPRYNTDFANNAVTMQQYAALGWNNSGDDNYSRWASAMRLCNNAGNDVIQLAAGSFADISVDFRYSKSYLGWDGNTKPFNRENLRVGLVFADRTDDIGGYNVDPTLNGLRSLREAGKLIEIGKINPNKTEVQTLNKRFKVPQHEANEYPALVIYTEDASSAEIKGEIFIQGVTVTRLTENDRPGDVNGDGAENILDLIRLKKDIAADKKTTGVDIDGEWSIVPTAGDLVALRKILLNR